jgi:ParB family transcriptional regulator, chromosome partitioning protein
MAKKNKPEAQGKVVLPEFRRIPIDRILEPELPARATMSDAKMDELVESMKVLGQLEPISVEQHDAMFELVTGHRRLLAARRLEWREIAAMVYAEGNVQAAAMMLHENACREDLNPAEEAIFMAQCREKFNLDEAGLCQMFHRGPDYIAGRFALLRGDPEIFAALQRGEIRLGVAHELNRITADDMRAYYLDVARRSDPPGRVVHQWVEQWRMQARQPVVYPIPPAGDAASSPSSEPPAPDDGSAEAPAPPIPGAGAVPRFDCQLCGGYKDPYNLIEVRIHKWHWEDILKAVERAGRGE